MFEQLTDQETAPPLVIFDELRLTYVEDPFGFAWNTDVPDVTDPWPTIEDPAPVSIRDAIQLLSGRQDVTSYLYSLGDLAAYTEEMENSA
jgi:hypothetical protein